jgi:hypothetical protein
VADPEQTIDKGLGRGDDDHDAGHEGDRSEEWRHGEIVPSSGCARGVFALR